jgi:Conjugal transfer protein
VRALFLASSPDIVGILQPPSHTLDGPDYACAVKVDLLNTKLHHALRKGRAQDELAPRPHGPLETLPAVFAPPLKPEALIRTAQQAATVSPTTRCYFGGSNVCRYLWTPNKLYPVYVSPSAKTKISLPPGERLAVALALNGDLWDVGTARVGSEPLQQDHIFIRPLTRETPNMDISLLTEAGHSFDIQLRVGAQGMFGVTWETPAITQGPADEDVPLLPGPVR